MTHVPKAVEVFLRAGDFEKAIEGFVATKKAVSFVELEAMLSPYMETAGDFGVTTGPAEELNIWFWRGMSEEWAGLIKGMMKGGQLKASPCTEFVYLVDGVYPLDPLVNEVPEERFEQPHWLPVVFDLVKT